MTQDQRMAAILLRLELLSFGATQAWNPSGGQSGEPDDKAVALIGQQFPHLVWRKRYDAQTSDLGRERIIADAQKELESWTHHTGPQVEGKTLVDLILEDGEGWEPKVVAERFCVDVAFVRRKRMFAGRGTEDGRAVAPEAPVDRVEQTAALSRRGLSQTQIARTLGISQPTVHRLLKEHRFRRSAAGVLPS